MDSNMTRWNIAVSVLCLVVSISITSRAQAQSEQTNTYKLAFNDIPDNREAKMLFSFLEDLDPDLNPRISRDRATLTVNTTNTISLDRILQYVSAFGLSEPQVQLQPRTNGSSTSNVMITYGEIQTNSSDDQ